MKTTAKLSEREIEVTELSAWGLSKKEVAEQLFISERTVESHLRNIYDKLNVNKITELSAWWFCTKYGISFDLSPLKRKSLAIFLLLALLPREFTSSEDTKRAFRTRATRSTQVRARRSRRNEREPYIFELS